jgi:adenylate cyclase
LTDVFLSYARQDRDRIAPLVRALEARGLEVWWDSRITGGAEFTREIEAQLEAAGAVLVAWSRNSIESLWVADEAGAGLERGKLVPISIDPVVPRIGFRQLHSLDFSAWNQDPLDPCVTGLLEALTAAGLRSWPTVEAAKLAAPRTTPIAALRRPIVAVPLAAVLAAALVLGLAFFAFDKFVLSESRVTSIAEQARQQGRTEALVESYGDKSIAVLPFVNMSSDVEQEYFSDGISEELLNLLAKIPELRVISRSSAFYYKAKEVKLAQVARELNVAHILEGSVRKSGNRVRITVQLIEARSDTHLWSETFERALEDVFAIQDEIASIVVEQLKLRLVGNSLSAKQTDSKAYDLYLRAMDAGRHQTAENLEQSNALLEQVLAIDPQYAPAWDRLARNYSIQANRGLVPVAEASKRARFALQRALESDPDFADAYSTLGWLSMALDNDLAEAARHHARAIELDSRQVGGASGLLYSLGRLEDAISVRKYQVQRNPLDPAQNFMLGLAYHFAGQPDEAIASVRAALRLSPGAMGFNYLISVALLAKGDHVAALDAAGAEPLEPMRLIALACAWTALGNQRDSEAAVAQLVEDYGDVWPYNIAYVYAYRGEVDRAFEWLGKAAELGDSGLSEINIEPLFRSIHGDPRWLPLLESIGRSPEQLAAIKFEVKLPAQ